MGGGDPDTLSPLGTAAWAGFETKLNFAGTPQWVEAQALDGTGKVIGRSPVIQPKTT
jgi:hypothetical protein